MAKRVTKEEKELDKQQNEISTINSLMSLHAAKQVEQANAPAVDNNAMTVEDAVVPISTDSDGGPTIAATAAPIVASTPLGMSLMSPRRTSV